VGPLLEAPATFNTGLLSQYFGAIYSAVGTLAAAALIAETRDVGTKKMGGLNRSESA
jgi:hypothetical protein